MNDRQLNEFAISDVFNIEPHECIECKRFDQMSCGMGWSCKVGIRCGRTAMLLMMPANNHVLKEEMEIDI